MNALQESCTKFVKMDLPLLSFRFQEYDNVCILWVNGEMKGRVTKSVGDARAQALASYIGVNLSKMLDGLSADNWPHFSRHPPSVRSQH